MPTQQQVLTTITTSQLWVAELTEVNRLSLVGGNFYVKWHQIDTIQRYINAVYRQYIIADYSSSPLILCYNKLLQLIGTFGTNTINPNYQGGGVIIEITYPISEQQILTPIIGGVTANPITVNYISIYSDMKNPTLIYRNADGSNYNGAVNNVDTGSAIVLTGDSDGSGHFADSFTFIIKQ